MITIRDFKGRVYQVLETCNGTTLLQDVKTRDRVRVRAWGWHDIGFIKP